MIHTSPYPALPRDRRRAGERGARRSWWLGLLLAGCGNVPATPDASSVDAPPDIDAAPGRCSPTAPFGAPVPLPGLNTAAHDYGAHGMPDELTAFFSRMPGEDARSDIYVATRATTTAVFSTPTYVAGVNAGGLDNDGPSVTADGLTLYQTAPGQVAGYDIFVATRTSVAMPFASVGTVTAVSEAGVSEHGPYALPDGSALYFSRQEASGDHTFRSPVGPAGVGAPVAVGGLSPNDEQAGYPVVSADELTIYFTSSRADPLARGGGDIWIAHRASPSDPFDGPVIVDELNSSGNDSPTWISPDGCVLWFDSDRAGSYDIYEARRGS